MTKVKIKTGKIVRMIKGIDKDGEKVKIMMGKNKQREK